jgi:hypothetical protein
VNGSGCASVSPDRLPKVLHFAVHIGLLVADYRSERRSVVMADDSKGARWWQTIPGALTAVAGVLTAVTGLVVALNQVGVLRGQGRSPDRPASAPTVTQKAAPSLPTAPGVPAEPSAPQHGAALPAPVPREPTCGGVIPLPAADRLFIRAWAPVEGASSYTVEVDCFGCGGKRQWWSQSGSAWYIRDGLGFRSPIYSSDIHTRFRQAGGIALRWRVWAVDPDGRNGTTSNWCQVAFAGDPQARPAR